MFFYIHPYTTSLSFYLDGNLQEEQRRVKHGSASKMVCTVYFFLSEQHRSRKKKKEFVDEFIVPGTYMNQCCFFFFFGGRACTRKRKLKTNLLHNAKGQFLESFKRKTKRKAKKKKMLVLEKKKGKENKYAYMLSNSFTANRRQNRKAFLRAREGVPRAFKDVFNNTVLEKMTEQRGKKPTTFLQLYDCFVV